MKNWTFKKWNTFLGWIVFAISLATYLSTIEPNFSFWDTGEYISSAVKLEVTHAPGAALFQLMGAVFGMFAMGNGSYYALIINAMSALFSAFTILFLFWTITHLVRRLLHKDFDEVSKREEIGILFAGVIGALCFAFSDTFWYSAVEGEVYSMASMFIALIVWLITKWENEYHTPDNERWIILIFFMIGLSVGVHMMCMLAVPMVCFMYYARNYHFSWKSFIYANLITLGVLSVVFKGIFPLIMTSFGKMEIFVVNDLGMPFHSGTIIAFVLLVGSLFFAIKWARNTGKKLFQTIVLSVVYMIIGFSCWIMIPIRANANPPMNLNNPDTAIGMLDYYNREQYGDWPTLYGQNYTAQLDANGFEKDEDGSLKHTKIGNIYEKDEKTGTYRIVGDRFRYVYNKEHISLFPRMFNTDNAVMDNYIKMYGAPDFEFNYEDEDLANSPEAKKIYEDLREKYHNNSISVNDYLQAKKYGLIKVKRPTLLQNLDYLFTFQTGYYFVRYLMWNFVGRQNDLEGHMENTNGNWISGISFIDDYLLGEQSIMPKKFRNDSTVAFFFLPLLLGLIGIYFQLEKDFKRFYAVLSLFILTSLGIIFYTGVKPFEPRERDYAMVGAFYAYAVWIGLGVAAIMYFIQKKVKNINANILVGFILMGIPMMMGFQNYTSHDRSGRYAAYDYAYSALKSLPQNTILFVYGDNDTYPVWTIQETENFRDDVKVVNFTLFSTTWNIDQVKRRTYNAMPIPSELTHEEYRDGKNEQIVLLSPMYWQSIFENLETQGISADILAGYKKYLTQDSMNVKDAMKFLRSSSEEKDIVLQMLFGEEKYEKYNFLPVNKFIIPVNKKNAVQAGIIKPQDLDKAVDNISITYKNHTMFKSSLMLLDILANFDWKRPISFSSGGIYDAENIFYLGDYLQFDGFNYRLVPIHTPEKEDGEMGCVDGEDLYNIVKNFRWGNFKDTKVHFDDAATSNIVSYRSSASRAAEALALAGKRQKAIEILDLANEQIPIKKYNDPRSLSHIVYGYIISKQEEKGLELAEELKRVIFEEYDYYTSLSPEQQRFLGRQMIVKPFEFSLIVSSVVKAYEKIGEKDKAYQYLVESTNTIDKRFRSFIEKLNVMDKTQAYRKADDVKEIMPFYEYLFEIMKPYDSTYANEKRSIIERELIKVTQ